MSFFILGATSSSSKYAEFSHVGTWRDTRTCDICGLTKQELCSPLVIEWDTGSDLLGDISWCGWTAVVTHRVRDYMRKDKWPVMFSNVVVQAPSGRSRQLRIAYPYAGPRLYWLRPKECFSLDVAASHLRRELECEQSKCGLSQWKFKSADLVVSAAKSTSPPIFGLSQFNPGGMLFVSEKGKISLKAQGFQNLGFGLVGRFASK